MVVLYTVSCYAEGEKDLQTCQDRYATYTPLHILVRLQNHGSTDYNYNLKALGGVTRVVEGTTKALRVKFL